MWGSLKMAETFRFSPAPNRAHEIAWRSWGGDALEEAARSDRPVLLNLTAAWCHWCHKMDETTFSDPDLIRRINEELVPIRVDADQYPHVQERYIVSGWPTNAFLTPTGEVLWAGTYVDPENFRTIMDGVLRAWSERRTELQREIERRRRALEAARGRVSAIGLVRREAADDILSAVLDSFDPRNGGFGDAPKFPQPEVLDFLFAGVGRVAEVDGALMAERTLDGILAGELWDGVEGGFFRYALAADWTSPRYEKLLGVNAGLLRNFATGAQLYGRRDWRSIAERTVDWADGQLLQSDGLWGGSQASDEEYYALDADGRRGRPRPWVDPVIYTDANAAWIGALADAGGRLGRGDWIERAAGAFEYLLTEMTGSDGVLYHFRAPGSPPAVPGLLVDHVEAARAALTLAQVTGQNRFLAAARSLAQTIETRLWAEDGGFLDHIPSEGDVGALRYRERPFDRNASAVRLFLDLAHVTGERSYRAIAERTLALLSPSAGRYGIAGAEFAMAVEEFFDPPLRFVVVGAPDTTESLRSAAVSLPVAARRVWTLERGGRIGSLTFPPAPTPAVYACGARGCSRPVTDAEGLAAAVQSIR